MPVRHYVAVVERGNANLSAFFPDLPGCVTAADDLEGLRTQAAEALALHVAGMLEDGEAIPAATPADRVPPDPEVPEFARILVPVDVPLGNRTGSGRMAPSGERTVRAG